MQQGPGVVDSADGGGGGGIGSGSGSALTDIPLALLRAELQRRTAIGPALAPDLATSRTAADGDGDGDGGAEGGSDDSECGSGLAGGSYNTSLHVAALFLILILSTFACSFPILARRFPRLPIPRRFLFLSRHFGTGVLIATAFVHLLPTAFVSLTNPCLPAFWNKGYPAMAGFVAMVAVMIVVAIEMFFALRGAGHVHGTEYDSLIGNVGQDNEYHHGTGDIERDIELEPTTRGENGRLHPHSSHHGNEPSENLVEDASPLISKHHRTRRSTEDDRASIASSNSESDLDLEELDPTPLPHPPIPQETTSPPPNPQKQLLQCLLLEAGILFHSIFIGMALSVATGASFAVLLVAISFHQTFEGFALGARISALIPALFTASNPKPWLMALAYGATTPLGQALGLGLHNLYDPASTTGLLMVGMTNAFSSGLLLFAGLVELLAEDFLSDRSYVTLRGRSRMEACGAVAAGAFVMAAVGAFA